MKFNVLGRFLGSEEKISQKGNKYNIVSFIQGTETISVMANEDLNLNFDFGQQFDGVLDYDTKFKNLRLVEING